MPEMPCDRRIVARDVQRGDKQMRGGSYRRVSARQTIEGEVLHNATGFKKQKQLLQKA
jgi:hypothetical protein